MLLFARLPEGFPTLARMAEPPPPPPPPLPDPGLPERLRKLFNREMERGYQGVSRNSYRKLPYAYFVTGKFSLDEEHPELVDRYWNEVLPEALRSSERRCNRWLGPLLRCYVDAFDPVGREFGRFAKKLGEVVRSAGAAGQMLSALRQLDDAYHFLTPDKVYDELATRAREQFRQQAPPFDLLLEQLGFINTSLGKATLRSILATETSNLRERELVFGLLHWVGRLETSVARSDISALFADALLSAWSNRQPEEAVRRALLEFFIAQYGDPRTGGNRQIRWAGVSDVALTVILRWLAGDTLRAFIKVLQQTADEIWEHREKFWMAFYDAGHIDEVWLALGRDARLQAREIDRFEGQRRYGSLDGAGVHRQHSVLLIKIGDLVFSEWSHSGSLRALSVDDPRGPRLYLLTYDGADIRDSGSLDFHDGRLQGKSLRHHGSSNGTWQRTARDFIRKHTGIYMSDSKIL
jgi:hypothetical protein